jgi:excisionase family DNA binding protein|tara:strand:- start:464 stop:721 length:258 start_codon:yes stop_codon:yes gene_type:complete
MEATNFTFNKEELKQLIEDAVYKANCTQPKLEYNIITEKELSERLNITKVTLHKYRKQGKIPFSQVGRTIRYDYKEVMEALKHKQ